MSGIISCKECVFISRSRKDGTLICRRRSPVPPVHQQNPMMDYVPATWPAVDDDDGCGEGEVA